MWAAGCPRCVQSFTEGGGGVFSYVVLPFKIFVQQRQQRVAVEDVVGVTVSGDVDVDVFKDGGVSLMRSVAGTAGLHTDVMRLWGGYRLYTRYSTGGLDVALLQPCSGSLKIL